MVKQHEMKKNTQEQNKVFKMSCARDHGLFLGIVIFHSKYLIILPQTADGFELGHQRFCWQEGYRKPEINEKILKLDHDFD